MEYITEYEHEEIVRRAGDTGVFAYWSGRTQLKKQTVEIVNFCPGKTGICRVKLIGKIDKDYFGELGALNETYVSIKDIEFEQF